MTSNTNVELAQKYFELSNNRDLDGIEQILTDSTTYSSPNVGVFLGVEQIMEMKHKCYGSFREMSWQVNIANEIRH